MSLDLPPKDLSKALTFVRLLASDRDGEVVNAARFLGRILKRNGKDFHDLADLLTISGKSVETPVWTPPKDWDWQEDEPEPEPPPQRGPPDVNTMSRTDQLAWLRLCMDKLTLERHDEFVVPDMASRLAGWSYHLNREQRKVLNRIVRRAWRLGFRI